MMQTTYASSVLLGVERKHCTERSPAASIGISASDSGDLIEIPIVMLVQLVGHDDCSASVVAASSLFAAIACGATIRKNVNSRLR
jgi:hypothetical protein